MKDKHFLLNSWQFFQQYINQIVLHLQRQAVQVYSNEQNLCSQRAFRLSSLDQKHSSARSLVKLTASPNVFSELHLWFTWLLSTAAKRLEEHLPTEIDNSTAIKEDFSFKSVGCKSEREFKEENINELRQLHQAFGAYNFQRLLYSTLVGRQIVVRGPKLIVESIVYILKLFLPRRKVCCQEFGDTYKGPEVCNIVGLDLYAAVPMSTHKIMRLDILPFQEIGNTSSENAEFISYKFIIKNERELPEKLPSLLVKIEKVLSDESLGNRVVWLRIKTLMEEWFHVAEVIREVRKKNIELHMMTPLLQSLGVQEQDYRLIDFWTS